MPMVEVGSKEIVKRVARARARVRMSADTVAKIRAGRIPKGDVLSSARSAGLLAMKQTPHLLPMCHPIALTGADVRFDLKDDSVEVEAEVVAIDRTGVEMEALAGAAIACLCIYDMCKGVDSRMSVEMIVLAEKTKTPL